MTMLWTCLLMALLAGPAWALTGAIPGAIYWPAWNTTTGSDANAQSILSRPESQPQAPWYCTLPFTSQVSCNQSQGDMDQDLQMAQAAGIKYWAWVWYGLTAPANTPGTGVGTQPLQAGWGLYQSSSHITDVNSALILIPAYLGATTFGSTTTDWHANVDYIVTLLLQGNQQKVLTTRPLVFILYQASDIVTYFNNSLANFGTAVAYLKSQAIVAGLGSPYVVMMGIGTGSASHTIMTTVGADAISNYVVSLGTANIAASKTYATLDAAVQTFWTTLASGGDKTVPILQTGGNIAARRRNPPPWEVTNIRPYMGLALVWDVGTPAAIGAGQFTAIGTYLDTNGPGGTNLVECNCFIIYSWTEHDEGYQAMQPERGDPPLTSPPYAGGSSTALTNLLNVLGPILWGYR